MARKATGSGRILLGVAAVVVAFGIMGWYTSAKIDTNVPGDSGRAVGFWIGSLLLLFAVGAAAIGVLRRDHPATDDRRAFPLIFAAAAVIGLLGIVTIAVESSRNQQAGNQAAPYE